MRALRLAQVALLATFLLLTTTVLAVADQALSIEESHWAMYEILDHGVFDQDISGDTVIYRELGEPLMLVNIKTKETRVLPVVGPCTDVSGVDDFRISSDWLVIQFKCSDVGDVMFQSQVYNLETGESFLLAPDPPDPELPFSWYVDIDDGRVVWSQLADCSNGDIYLMDLESREVTKVDRNAVAAAGRHLHLGPDWLVWDEYKLPEHVLSVHGVNLVDGDTFYADGFLPLAGSSALIWHERNSSGSYQIRAYDLVTKETRVISASGDLPFAADLDGDRLLILDKVPLDTVSSPIRKGANTDAGLPNEPCDFPLVGASGQNRVRVYDLTSDNDVFRYYNPEARYLYEAQIDGKTAIWDEYVRQYPNEINHVLAARRFDHQFYMPLVFR